MKKTPGKLILLLGCTVCSFLLCGFFPFTKPAELKSPSVKLIDLGEMVRDSEPGKGGNREASEIGTATEKDGTRTGDGAGKKQQEEEKELIVTVQDDRIYLNGVQMKSITVLRARLTLEYKGNHTAKLVDDYASWKTYSDVYKALRDAGITPEEERKS